MKITLEDGMVVIDFNPHGITAVVMPNGTLIVLEYWQYGCDCGFCEGKEWISFDGFRMSIKQAKET